MKYDWKTLALVGIISGGTTLAGYKFFVQGNGSEVVLQEASAPSLARFASGSVPPGAPGDFISAAEVSTPMVVHIKSIVVSSGSSRRNPQMDFFRDFFGEGFPGEMEEGPRRREGGTGSGVIITSDGYIVTNNHVVEGATELEVTLHNKTKIPAKVIGTDPSTDIAVIKIDSKNLPAITFANSDEVRVGEWVLAVGNPFNLESTVTAGIVSAKGRGLGIIGSSGRQQRRTNPNQPQVNDAIESFIQTDAVVNPGNSGGALVNLRGELIGINTAIASPTGSYAGYAFAVPSTIVKKVSTDLIKFGNAQRGYLGVTMEPIDNKIAEDKGLKVSAGVLVNGLAQSSAAEEAGIKVGDVIVKIGENRIASIPDLTQAIALHRPGDKINVTVNRDGKDRDFNVTLRNRDGGSGIVKKDETAALSESLGATLEGITKEEKAKLTRHKIEGGVKVTDVGSGKLARRGVEPGFIITKINGTTVNTVNDVAKALSGKTDTMVQFEGLYLDAPYDIYTFGFRL